MRSIERLNGPDIMSWPECARDVTGMGAPGGLPICMGWGFRILPAESDGWPAWAGSILVLSADGLDIDLCAVSECEGIPVIAGLVDGCGFLVAETGFFTAARFFTAALFVALAARADCGLAAVFFFAGAFDAFVFGLPVGFFFAVSLTPGILCPSC